MHTEFEAKILEIDVAAIQEALKRLGAKKIGEKSQRRYVYDLKPKQENAWIRLRTNGEHTTLAVKHIHNDEVDGTKEIEVKVEDFEKTNLLLQKLGYTPKAYQENRRISYELEGAEIDIDFWPMIPAYLEVEADSSEVVKKTLAKLGCTLSESTSKNTKEIYRQYGIDIDKMAQLRFRQT